MSSESEFSAGLCVGVLICLLIFIPIVFSATHVAETKMWQEAEKRGYAVQVEHSGGTGYKWKDE